MTKRNNERINRNLAIILVVMANSIVWGALAAFVTAWNKFTGLNNDAQSAADKAEQQIKGWARNKKNARRTMADAAMHIKGALQAYAKANGNDMELFDAVDFSHTKITQGRSVVALQRCSVIYKRASAIISMLNPFGVTATTLSDFQNLMTTYQNLISAPINAKEARKTYNKQVSDILNLADDALKNEVAKLMENFKTSAPAFYQQFFNDLRLMHGATNFTEIKANCYTDTGAILPGVLLTITNDKRNYTVTSDFTGAADKKSMEPGTYRLLFTKSGFQDHIIENIHIGLSEYETFTINMIPS